MHTLPSELLEHLPLADSEQRRLASTATQIRENMPTASRRRMATSNLRKCYERLGHSLSECAEEAKLAFEITQDASFGVCQSMAHNQQRYYIRLSNGLLVDNQCKFLLAANRSRPMVTSIIMDRPIRDDAHDRLFCEIANQIRVHTCLWGEDIFKNFRDSMLMASQLTNVHKHRISHREGRGRPGIFACGEADANGPWSSLLLQYAERAEIILVSDTDNQPVHPFAAQLPGSFLAQVEVVNDDTCIEAWSDILQNLDGQFERFNGSDANDDDGHSIIIVATDPEMATALACVFHILSGMRTEFSTSISSAELVADCDTLFSEGIPMD
tara:strand:+ start:490 stop:1470 length:981 start_codon:yes stop_codon:yes gene_type:complete